MSENFSTAEEFLASARARAEKAKARAEEAKARAEEAQARAEEARAEEALARAEEAKALADEAKIKDIMLGFHRWTRTQLDCRLYSAEKRWNECLMLSRKYPPTSEEQKKFMEDARQELLQIQDELKQNKQAINKLE